MPRCLGLVLAAATIKKIRADLESEQSVDGFAKKKKASFTPPDEKRSGWQFFMVTWRHKRFFPANETDNPTRPAAIARQPLEEAMRTVYPSTTVEALSDRLDPDVLNPL
ncbi:MAG: hypothetical protein NTY87_08015 [Planctomycetia bacterium]|nr:hypothetical protein [Planctomycetia bacterium]